MKANNLVTDSAVVVREVAKYFPPSMARRNIKQAVTTLFNKRKEVEQSGYWALRKVSFEVKRGEFFGIVGRNGSGKSTLLKMIAGVYTPTSGVISVSGKLVPFIELGVGFNPELSGRDNVFLNGALLGFSSKEMEELYDEIVDFAELQDHMHVKLKNFSSGMQVRLAFSIAIRARADILLIDEVLAVGDALFQQKCYDYFSNLKEQGRTVIFVSHDIGAIEKFCDRVAVIEKTKLVAVGAAKEMIKKYTHLLSDTTAEPVSLARRRSAGGDIYIRQVQVINASNKVSTQISEGEPILIRVNYSISSNPGPVVFGIGITDDSGTYIMGPNSKEAGVGELIPHKNGMIEVRVSPNPLTSGKYYINVGVFDSKHLREHAFTEKASYFWIIGVPRTGYVRAITEWNHKKGKIK